ncbi:MAG: class I SAM-dependent methyltransferase [Cellvibrionaceae bacterium]
MFEIKPPYNSIFDIRAKSYHQAMTTWPETRRNEFDIAVKLANIKDNNIIVDIPSGGGYLSDFIPSENDIYHIETSINFAKLSKTQTDHYVILTDEQSIPIKNNTIDNIISIAGLHHTNNKSAVFTDMYRILKTKGNAVIADVNYNSKTATFLDKFVNSYNSIGHKGDYFNCNTTAQIKNCGFSIAEDFSKEYYWVFNNKKQMANYCQLLFGLDQASEDEVIDGIAEFLGFTEDNNKVNMRWELRFIKAIKNAP